MSRITVYLSNTEIQVLLGNGTPKGPVVKRCCSMQVPRGSILNGVITDAPSLAEAIGRFWKLNRLPEKDIDLVVNSPRIMVRVSDIPLLSAGRTQEYLKREYVERDSEQILGCFRISSDKKTRTAKVCAEVADADFISGYLQVFSEAGITLSGICSGVGAAINMFKKTGFVGTENSVILIRDDMTVTAVFFVKGEYYYSTTARIFSEAGSSGYAKEVAGIINQIDQFSRSQKLEDPISTVYLAGMEEADRSLCSEAIAKTLQAPVAVSELIMPGIVDESAEIKKPDTLVYPAAGLVPRTDHVNILRSVKKEKTEAGIRRERLLRFYLPYVITALIMTGITVYLFGMYRSRMGYLDSLVNYNNDPQNKNGVAEYDAAAERVAVLSRHYGGLRALETNVNSYPAAIGSVWSVIRQDAAGVGEARITGYDSVSGELSFTTSFHDVAMVNEFIGRLKEEDIFESVDYKGYSETGSEDGSDRWTALLSCRLSEQAGRDVIPAPVVDEEKSALNGTESGETK